MAATEPQQLHGIQMAQRDSVGIITLDRPERFNSFDVRMAQDLRKAGLKFARDNAVRCIVLAGQDKVFCSGVDLKYVREHGASDDLAYLTPGAASGQAAYGAVFKQILEYVHSTISELRRAPKPVIAAVKGIAAAGGLGLAMACDLVFASQSATFEWAYGRTGLTGAESATFFAPHLAGLQRAQALALLNPRLNAQAAVRAGLVAETFPDADFDTEVAAVAKRLAEGPTRAFGVAKGLMNEAVGAHGLEDHLSKEAAKLVDAADGKEFAEGLDAFFTKRAPDFRSPGL